MKTLTEKLGFFILWLCGGTVDTLVLGTSPFEGESSNLSRVTQNVSMVQLADTTVSKTVRYGFESH